MLNPFREHLAHYIYLEATTDQLFRLSGALNGEGIDVQRFDRSYGSHAVAAIFVPIVHKTFLK